MANRVIAFIVGFIFSGLGYLFTGDYFYAIGTFAVCVLLNLTGNIYALIFSLILWIFALIDVDRRIRITA
ncbi:MAG: hypothetical protein E7Z86_00155 [Methanosphaera stadtmanae]|jgi:membrane protein implicated in regulation of membrane protease activity|nr:hypothetical protein [Methanosphaera stadtmanae]